MNSWLQFRHNGQRWTQPAAILLKSGSAPLWLLAGHLIDCFEQTGLVISKQLIEFLGDKNIDIKSEPGQGTIISFVIYDKYSPIPALSGAGGSIREFAADDITPQVYLMLDKKENWENLEKKGLIPSFRHTKRETSIIKEEPKPLEDKVFITLDDTPLNLVLLKMGIQKLKPSAIVHEFNSPEKLIEFLQENNFTRSSLVFFLDIEVSSKITGFDVARLIKRSFSIENCVSFLVFSYSSHSEETIGSQSKDFDGFLPKPFKEPDLINFFKHFRL